MTSPGNRDGINWPARFHPDVSPVQVRNELDMAAPIERVWAELIRARDWPTWYPNAKSVTQLSGAEDLANGVRFRWTTFDATIVSDVAEFVPPSRIAWTGKAFGIDVYHAWLLTPSRRGTFVLTEEAQYGFLTRLSSLVSPSRMSHHHQIWLEALERRAAA